MKSDGKAILSVFDMHLQSRLLQIPSFVAAAALFLLMALTFCDVILRSMFNAPIEIAADLTRLLMAIMVFSVLPTLSAQGGNISVDLLEGYFSRPNMMRWSDIAINLVCGAMLVLPAKRIFDLAERSRSYGDVMEYMRLPVHYVGWFVALMTTITAVVLIMRALILLVKPSVLEAPQ